MAHSQIRNSRPGQRSLWALIALTCCFASPCHAASDPAVVALEDSIRGKQLCLRSFSADKDIQYTWSAGHLIEKKPPRFHALSVFLPQSVSLSGSELTIRGRRTVAFLNGAAKTLALSPVTDNVRVHINLNGASPTVLLLIPLELAFPNVETAIRSLPDPWRRLVPGQMDSSIAYLVKLPSGWKSVKADEPGIEPVRPLDYNPNDKPAKHPPVSQERKARAGLCGFLVDDSGSTTDVWILISSDNIDLDYFDGFYKRKWRPATSNGQAVSFVGRLEFDFDVHPQVRMFFVP